MDVTIARLMGEIEGSAYCHLVAQRNQHGEPVGYAQLRRDDREGTIYLYDLLVVSHLRRMGVARELCREAERIAQAPGLALAAYTSPENEASQAFFRAIGWRHYRTDEDGCLWWTPQGEKDGERAA